MIDVVGHAPSAETYVLDTNIWLRLADPTFSTSGYNLASYDAFVKSLLEVGATLGWSGVLLFEVAHVIELAERERYNAAYSGAVGIKRFRHYFPGERANVLRRVKFVMDYAGAHGRCIDLSVNQNSIPKMLEDLGKCEIDGYDLGIIESMKQAELSKFVTNDGDFVSVPGITVYTANPAALDSKKPSVRT